MNNIMNSSATKNTHLINKKLKKYKKLTLPSGKIYINSTIIFDRNDYWLEGQGASTKLILLPDSNCDIIKITNDRCMVSNLMLIGNQNDTSGNGILIKKCIMPLHTCNSIAIFYI